MLALFSILTFGVSGQVDDTNKEESKTAVEMSKPGLLIVDQSSETIAESGKINKKKDKSRKKSKKRKISNGPTKTTANLAKGSEK